MTDEKKKRLLEGVQNHAKKYGFPSKKKANSDKKENK